MVAPPRPNEVPRPGTFRRSSSGTLGGEQSLTVDDGGGLHDASGARIGAIRRTPSGEWIVDRQNDTAERSDSTIPAARRPANVET